MKSSAIFFDRDNTLIINDGYLGDPAKTVLMPGAADAIARARQLGFVVVTISNQSGVARGLFDEAAVQAVNRRMEELLWEANHEAVIDLQIYCPFHPDAIVPEYCKVSDLRKPAPGMILEAAKKLDLDLTRCWVIGDALRDIEAGIAAGCRTILFVPPNVPASTHATSEQNVLSNHLATELKTAIDLIETESIET